MTTPIKSIRHFGVTGTKTPGFTDWGGLQGVERWGERAN